jgi:adenine phosphoribosyltransferase
MIVLENKIRTVKDFPKKGIGFKDITTLIKDGDAFKEAISQIGKPFENSGVELILGIEARGFIFASALAYAWNVGIIPVRKPGKLPANTIAEEYELEYGSDSIEIHKDAIQPGEKILIVDDLLATGGTVAAATRLVERLHGDIIGISFLLELAFLRGRDRINQYTTHSVIIVNEE